MRTLLLLFTLCFEITLFAQSADRNNDPVVLTGDSIPCLLNQSPADVVGFKFDNGWVQVPIQIDERALLDVTTPYGPFAPGGAGLYNALFYTDSTTYIGADPDSLFDGDDELAFMAKDMGTQRTTFEQPPGTLNNACCELRLEDPLNGNVQYLYLFLQNGNLAQDAGVDYVQYDFNLLAGTYPDDFSLPDGLNPENTTVTTAAYSLHFSAEWVLDEWRITAGGATAEDILDRHQNFFFPGFCGRTEDSFSDAENAFMANIDGPVRGIRSVMGANSGPVTQRTNIFYESRHDIFTDLRVHNIPSIYDVFDYETAVSGMTYYSSEALSGNNIDGTPESVNGNPLDWEMVDGPAGALVSSVDYITDMVIGTDVTVGAYYEDNTSNPVSNCTGDQFAYGTSGSSLIFLGNICTDPTGGGCGVSSPDYRELQAIRRTYSLPPNTTTTTAAAYDEMAKNPIVITSAILCHLACIENLYLPEDPIVPDTYQAGTQVLSDGKIPSGEVIFKAGDNVLLEAGFEVREGATFETLIEGCN